MAAIACHCGKRQQPAVHVGTLTGRLQLGTRQPADAGSAGAPSVRGCAAGPGAGGSAADPPAEASAGRVSVELGARVWRWVVAAPRARLNSAPRNTPSVP